MSDLKEKNFFKKHWKLIVGAAFLLLFLVLIVLLKTVDVAFDEATGKEIGLSSVNLAARDAIGEHYRLYDLTQYLGYFAILIAAGFAVWACVRFCYARFNLRKMGFDFLVLAALYVAVLCFYVFFELVVINYRPVLLDGAAEASFPSSHTMLSITVFVSAAKILYRRFNPRVSPILFSLPFWALAAFVAVARLFSGVHWLTDILGGVLLSLALIFLFSFFSDRVPIETDEKKEAEETDPAPAE
ncbi:MAG: phosphatase PAP2 family protein [Clostridia bacterium]|nr:phosphatase PAP2 family protein [Clostridia bacterium]MBR5044821.1 phosphatase PAP2 family protein [Clostridia bacterium]